VEEIGREVEEKERQIEQLKRRVRGGREVMGK
jgi:hypothetical protein